MIPDGIYSALLLAGGIAFLAFVVAFSLYAGVIAASRAFGVITVKFDRSAISVYVKHSDEQ